MRRFAMSAILMAGVLVPSVTAAPVDAVLTEAVWTEEGVSLSWIVDSSATEVIVERTDLATLSSTTFAVGAASGGHVDAVEPGDYMYRITPVGPDGEGDPSNPMVAGQYPRCWPTVFLIPPGYWWPQDCYWPPPVGP